MRLCAAQLTPAPGSISSNLPRHLDLIEQACSHNPDFILFPELSLTGYEPTLAAALATTPEDTRFDDLQAVSNARQVTIAVGLPLKASKGITISLLLFRPRQARTVYAKQYLHPDEQPFFVAGEQSSLLNGTMALAICYELSVPAHAEAAFRKGATCYLASVAKTAAGMASAGSRLAQVARDYHMPVLVANSTGLQDGMQCAGGSAAWNSRGEQLGQLPESGEGLLLADTQTGEVSCLPC